MEPMSIRPRGRPPGSTKQAKINGEMSTPTKNRQKVDQNKGMIEDK